MNVMNMNWLGRRLLTDSINSIDWLKRANQVKMWNATIEMSMLMEMVT